MTNNHSTYGMEAEIRSYFEREEIRDREAKNSSRSGTIDGHLMFVYGSLKKNYGNHDLLRRGNGVFIGEGITSSPEFDMMSMTAFPAVYRGGKHQIAGEVYAVDNSCLRTLDQLEGNGHFYTRAETLIRVQNRFGLGKVDFEVPAWIYLVPSPTKDGLASWERLYRPDGERPEGQVLNWNR